MLKIIFKFLTFLFNHFLDEGIPYFRQVLRSHILFIEPFFSQFTPHFLAAIFYDVQALRRTNPLTWWHLWNSDVSNNWLAQTLQYLPCFLKICQCNPRISTIREFFSKNLNFYFCDFKNLFFICFIVRCNDGSNTDLYPNNKRKPKIIFIIDSIIYIKLMEFIVNTINVSKD